MSRLVPFLAALLALPAPALACGGFFCNAQIEPVVQTAERVLFRVNDDDTITSVVEIQFQGEVTEFAWIVPIPHVIDPEDISTEPAGLFDDLERLTAPRFVAAEARSETADAMAVGYASGCMGCSPWAYGVGDEMIFPEPEGVEVVGQAVVGPYAAEVITAEDGLNLNWWLFNNGYRVPPAATDLIQHYVDLDMAFLGLKLNPDVPAGPIDAISFTFDGDTPMLPIVLTSIAAVQDMDIVTYVLAEERYAPDNYGDARNHDDQVTLHADGSNDYEDLLPGWIDEAGGRAWATEFAMPTSTIIDQADTALKLLGDGAHLTRFRTIISPDEMTLDPCWAPAPGLPDVSNVRWVRGAPTEVAGVLGLVLLGLLRRRFV